MLTAVSIAEDDINLTYNDSSMFIVSCLHVCLSLFFSLVCLTVRCPGCLGYCHSTLSNILRKVPNISGLLFGPWNLSHSVIFIWQVDQHSLIQCILFMCLTVHVISPGLLILYVEVYPFVIHWCCHHHSHTMFSSEHMLLTSCHQIDWPYTSPHFILTKAW